jgi:hypothetical protein
VSEFAQMLLQRWPEEGWDERAGLAKRQVHGRGPGIGAVKKGGKARKGRSDKVVEISELAPIHHVGGLRYGVVRGNGFQEAKKN